jgi:hypothetical protein
MSTTQETAPLVTVSEFLEDLYSIDDVANIDVKVLNVDEEIIQYTKNYNNNVISVVIQNEKFLSILTKNDKNFYIFCDIDMNVDMMYEIYLDICDIKTYKDGYICIHEQTEKYQVDYMNDMIQRSYAIMKNEDFPDTVPIFFDLDEEEYNYINKLATETGQTFDDFVMQMIVEHIEHIEQEGNLNAS